MFVYRIEHKLTGKGPMNRGVGKYRWFHLFNDHTDPMDDETYVDYIDSPLFNHYKCDLFYGTKEIKFLIDIIRDGTIEILQEHGFVGVIYEVTQDFVVLGDGQVAFIKEKAKLISEHEDILDFLTTP